MCEWKNKRLLASLELFDTRMRRTGVYITARLLRPNDRRRLIAGAVTPPQRLHQPPLFFSLFFMLQQQDPAYQTAGASRQVALLSLSPLGDDSLRRLDSLQDENKNSLDLRFGDRVLLLKSRLHRHSLIPSYILYFICSKFSTVVAISGYFLGYCTILSL